MSKHHSLASCTPMPARAVAIARAWIGTPYHHQASVKGIGTDCLGLVRGVWRELYGHEAEVPPRYSADWAETGGHEAMIEAASRHLIPIAREQAAAGDVLIFRFKRGRIAKHAAIATGSDAMIHAVEGVAVSEVPISHWWRRHIAAAFRFPEI